MRQLRLRVTRQAKPRHQQVHIPLSSETGAGPVGSTALLGHGAAEITLPEVVMEWHRLARVRGGCRWLPGTSGAWS